MESNLAKFEPRAIVPTTLDAYTPTNFDQALRIAESFAKSGMLAGFATKEQVLLVMAVGAELGIPATTALRSIHIISGKPVMSADLMAARVLASPACEYFRCVDSTDESATYETKRRGNPPTKQTFTAADAKRAGLMKSGSNHEKYPRVMLRHRASAELARLVYPDVILGLYVEGEITESRTVEPLTAAPVVDIQPEPETAPSSSFFEDIQNATSQETLDAVRLEMKAAFGTVPAELVDAWRAREKELRA